MWSSFLIVDDVECFLQLYIIRADGTNSASVDSAQKSIQASTLLVMARSLLSESSVNRYREVEVRSSYPSRNLQRLERLFDRCLEGLFERFRTS